MLSLWTLATPLFGRLRFSSLLERSDPAPGAAQSPSVQGFTAPRTEALAAPTTWGVATQVDLLRGNSQGPLYFFCKRCTDVFVAGIALLALFPLVLLIAVLIKVDSAGPVFFTHERVGAKRQRGSHGAVWVVRHFGMHKFRSMFQSADSRVHEAYIRDFVEGRARPAASGGKFKLTNDPRVTRIGRLLRRTSLDELPQLFNVLKGQMSLVGPRPVPPYEVACYRNGDHQRLTALPGITGLWQVDGRCLVTFEEMIRMDLEYVRKASFWLDLRILFKTIPAVLCGRGAE